MNRALARLARWCGIALSYRDVWGHEHETAATSLIALLGAMGIAAADDVQADAALADLESQRWRRVLPRVVVHFAHDPPLRVRLNLLAALDGATLQWGIDEEGGRALRGEFVACDLPQQESGAADGRAFVARELTIAENLRHGYHSLWLRNKGVLQATCRLIVAPAACYTPRALEGAGRVWGATAQVYALRSERNWGIGDYSDLATLVELWGRHGAGIIGVNPLHALFPLEPERTSPYSPSSRRFLNTLLIDVEAIDDYRESDAARATVHAPAFQSRLQALRAGELVDYAGVAAAKREILEAVFAHFQAEHLQKNSARARVFGAWRRERGDALRRHALFEALQEHCLRTEPGAGHWQAWPDEFRRPDTDAVARFAHERADRVTFYEYLQWQADLQLGAVGRRSYELGLGVGLYGDLAVSVDRSGAEAWANQDMFCFAASIGAPPDAFNLNGQDWGLPPFDPRRLHDAEYAPFIATLRANMQHTGALRIDHVMALTRLYWVPAGASPAEGAYVEYPLDDLLGIVALESQRNRCVVVGEDLGTVPDALRARLDAAGVLSYRLLYFERTAAGDFAAPATYPGQALVAASTHDLPTLAGWWEGRDLTLRASLGLFPRPELREQQIVERAQDRARLLLALEREALLPPGATVNPVSLPAMTPAFCQAIHQFLARSPARIVVAQLEDVIEALDAVNVPGTTAQQANWRRKLALALERWPGDERFVALARLFERERGGGRTDAARRKTLAAVIPRATYRVQLHRDFRFADARALVPYLAALGVSHLYCSPFLRARPGSRHGYDIVDHNQFNPEIGSRDDFEALAATLKRHAMGLLIDVVPNHMGVLGADNAWWMDVLENGPASMFAEFFDIDWNVADPALAQRVLLPVLGDQYGVVLERGELKLAFEADTGCFALRYYDHRLPIDPGSYPRVLEHALHLMPPAALDTAAADAVASLLASFRHLPPRESTDAAQRAERHRDKEVHKGGLAHLVREYPALGAGIEQAVTFFNGAPQQRSSFDALDALIDAQAYRLAFWRVAADEINYRRFFDINDLAALRMEEPQVFDATHRLVLDLATSGRVDGLRIDHPDGLFDPAGYFRRLQQRYAQSVGHPGAASMVAGERPARPLYVVAEKIVAPHERLPEDWAVHGTTGYRFANVVTGLFIDTGAKARLDHTWRAFVGGEAVDFDDLASECRALVMRTSLAGELGVLASALRRLARADRRTRDFTLSALRRALSDVVANFPVYRTYIVEHPSALDRRLIDWAVGRAKRRSRVADASVFDFVHAALLARTPAGADEDLATRYLMFARRLQQFTAPVTAKGIEDTAFYRHQRLVALNEVGGDPDGFGITVRAFHGASRDRARHWPHTMLATSSHDTKRSEDVRARLAVISEMPAAWRLTVRRWSRLNRSHRREVDGDSAPARNDEYLLYQTLVGTLPADMGDGPELAAYHARIDAYMLKAVREAKLHSSWIAPNAPYEAGISGFVGALLGRLEGNPFLQDLRNAAQTFAWFGALNGIAMAAIKCTSPGVPDVYQGEELIELALVDPDNRRAVDYERRRRTLDGLQAMASAPDFAPEVQALLQTAPDGRAKLWTLWRALRLRCERPALFERGGYEPVNVTGTRARHAVAYLRRHEQDVLILVSGRLFASLGLAVGEPPTGAVWRDTAADLSSLPSRVRLADVLTGTSFDIDPERSLMLAQVLARFPVAILHGRGRE